MFTGSFCRDTFPNRNCSQLLESLGLNYETFGEALIGLDRME